MFDGRTRGQFYILAVFTPTRGNPKISHLSMLLIAGIFFPKIESFDKTVFLSYWNQTFSYCAFVAGASSVGLGHLGLQGLASPSHSSLVLCCRLSI